MQHPNDGLTPRYARHLLWLARRFPNFDVSFVKPLRDRAVRSLRLAPGDRVLDAGCGIGGSFPYLANAVGPDGEVTGIEISPETVASARRRIEMNGWANVSVLLSSAEAAPLTGTYDALVMFAAPDVYGSEVALANLLPHLRIGARIVLFGAKQSRRPIGAVLNPLLRLAVSKLSFDTTPLPSAEPWRLVAAGVDRLEIHEYFFGTMFLASGSLATMPSFEASTSASGELSKGLFERSSSDVQLYQPPYPK